MEGEFLTRIDVLVVILFYHIAAMFIRIFISAFYPKSGFNFEERLDILERKFDESTLGCYDKEGG